MKIDVSLLIYEAGIMQHQHSGTAVGDLLVFVKDALEHLSNRVEQLEKEKKQLKKAKLSASMGFDI